MRLSMTPEDFLKGKLITPGFYPAVISKVSEELSKGGTDPKTGLNKDQVNMLKIEYTVLEGEFKGTILYDNIPENFPARGVMLLKDAFGAEVDEKKGVSMELTPAQLKGKTLDVHVVRGSWNNKPKNEVDGYRKFTGKQAPTAQAGV